MMQYSLLDRRPEETCLDLLNNNDVGVLARGSIAKGLLANKPPVSYLNYTEQEVRKAAAAIAGLSGKHRTSTQTAIRFVLQHAAITSAVAGIRTIEQLEDIVQSVTAVRLEDEEMVLLKQALPVNYYDQHR